ncbi:MAG: acetate uptake transporter [Candidatus Thermoplasmatota archaeon]|nr:acetate uptake transporter [Candidatus Thermoplasmatota archaeon]
MVQKKVAQMAEQKGIMNTEISIKNLPVAEPAALGLIGLAVAALVLASADLQLVSHVPSKSLMIPWVLFFGATAQLIAGAMEFKRNNIFGATVFSVYAMTMYAIALTLFLNNSSVILAGNIAHYAYGLIGILFFSLIATVASLMTNKVFVGILLAVDLAVVLLIPHYLYEMSAQPAGVFLLLTSVLSFYGAAAILLNTMAGRAILPLGKPLWAPKK